MPLVASHVVPIAIHRVEEDSNVRGRIRHVRMHAHIALTFRLSCGANPKLRALRLRARLRLHRDIRQSPEARDLLPAQIPAEAAASALRRAQPLGNDQVRRAAGAHFPWPIGSEQQKDWEESAASGTSKLTANRQCFSTCSEACAAQPRVAALRLAIRSAMVEHSRSGAG